MPCSFLPDMNLPTDSDGVTIDLNGPPSPSRLLDDIESPNSCSARNSAFMGHLDRLQDEVNNLESEVDPNRRRVLIEDIDEQLRALERELEIQKAKDAQTAHQYARLREVICEEYQNKWTDSPALFCLIPGYGCSSIRASADLDEDSFFN